MFTLIFTYFACQSSKSDTAQTADTVTYHQNGYNFRSAESCRECHPAIVEQWSHTSHATTAQNPIYTKMAEKFLRDRGSTFASTTCTGCHMPGGPMIQEPALLPYEQRNPIAKEGVTCDACHTANEKTDNLIGEFEAIRLTFAKSDVVFGSRDMGNVDGHTVQQSNMISSPDLCLGCHDPHITYYNSQADNANVTCADCHMTTTPGNPYTGEFTHQIVGLGYAYSLSVENAENKEELLAKKQEWLENALAIGSVSRSQQNAADILEVEIDNLFNAHWIPSVGGVNNLRQLWVALEVWDDNGTLLFESGQLDSKQDLKDAFSDDVRAGVEELDTQLCNFQTIDQTLVQGSSHTVPLSIDSSGTHIENSIYSGEARVIEYILPSNPNQNIHVKVQLQQRHYTPYMLREIDLDDLSMNIPIITIDTWEGDL